jgi:hypothetical protein
MTNHQQRYEAHQKRKAEVLKSILMERHSERIFKDEAVSYNEVLEHIEDARDVTPSSCDRRGTHCVLITDRDEKAILSTLLVGGVGWLHRAPLIILLFGVRGAYKAPGEINYMPYLDSGFLACNIINLLTAADYKTCFVNPNIREMNKEHFNKLFNSIDNVFCGAIAVGREV